MWDTAGQDRFSALTSIYYRNADAAVFVYDASNQKSFDNIQVWMQNSNAYIGEEVLKILVANKCDLSSTVSRTAAQEFADKQQMLVSINTG